MKYTLIVIAILQLSIFGCSSNPKVPTEPEVVASPVPTGTPLAGSGEITLNPIEYYTTAQERTIIKQAEKKLNEVKKSKCVHDFLSQRKMIQTQGKTSEQVADHIASLGGSVDVVMYYRKFTSAVAYREPPELKINLNRKFFYASLPICQWVSTILHESLHALAEYEHDYNYSPSRDYSVNYSANFAVDACCK